MNNTTLTDYATLEGQIARTIEKAQLLQDQLQNNPHLVNSVEDETIKLELEMTELLKRFMSEHEREISE